MSTSPLVKRHNPTLLFLMFAVMIGGIAPAAAEEIQVVAGYLSVEGTPGPLFLAGERGFTAQLQPQEGIYLPAACNADPLNCLPGTTLRLDAGWSNLDLPGMATLDGVTYTAVGEFSGPTSMTVRFEGAVVLPALAETSTVSAPFQFSGTFTHQAAGGVVATENLTGAGVATVTLGHNPFFPQSWTVRRVVYRLESPLPTPWSTTDIGSVGTPGAASYVDGTFFVIGDGADIWGSADAFRYVYQPLRSADAEIVARVTGEQNTDPFAKAGLMIRETLAAASPTAILDVKPDGGIEFMVRQRAGDQMMFVAGGSVTVPDVWLRLVKTENQITAFQSTDGSIWTQIGEAILPLEAASGFVGLAVTSHDDRALNLATFEHVTVSPSAIGTNLLVKGGFEEYDPPVLGLPGWVSDDFRQTPAKSETNQPHSGAKNGACWSTMFLDCGMFQTVEAPVSGIYLLTFYATADRFGGLVGADVDGTLAASANVEARPFGDYGQAYAMSFSVVRGQTIVVWMYSPAIPGYVVIDDVSLVALPTFDVIDGVWSTLPFDSRAQFTLIGDDVQVSGQWDAGVVDGLRGCCAVGQVVRFNSFYENPRPQTDVSFASGTFGPDPRPPYSTELGGALTFTTEPVTIPAPEANAELLSVRVPFTLTGELKGFDVIGRREPRLVFDRPIAGRGTATADLLVFPSGSLQFLRIRYEFGR